MLLRESDCYLLAMGFNERKYVLLSYVALRLKMIDRVLEYLLIMKMVWSTISHDIPKTITKTTTAATAATIHTFTNSHINSIITKSIECFGNKLWFRDFVTLVTVVLVLMLLPPNLGDALKWFCEHNEQWHLIATRWLPFYTFLSSLP